GRGLPFCAGARHAPHRRPGHGHRPPVDGPRRPAQHPRGDPVPAAPQRKGRGKREEGRGGQGVTLPSVRHMTATGFLVWKGPGLLHWHRRNQLWLPFGGHIEANEDPVQTVLREIEEESGIAAELITRGQVYPFAEPRQLPPPVTILLERATDGRVWHE